MTEDIKKQIDIHLKKEQEYKDKLSRIDELLLKFENAPIDVKTMLELKEAKRIYDRCALKEHTEVRVLEFDNCNHIWAESTLTSDKLTPCFCMKCGLIFTFFYNDEAENITYERIAIIRYLRKLNIKSYEDFIAYTKTHGYTLDYKCNRKYSTKIYQDKIKNRDFETIEKEINEFVKSYEEVHRPASPFRGIK